MWLRWRAGRLCGEAAGETGKERGMNKVKASLLDWVVAWVLSVLELAGMVLLIGLLMAGCARCARCLGVEYGTTFV